MFEKRGMIMARIHLKTTLKNKEETKIFEGFGILEENKISYMEDNVVTTLKKEGESIFFTRKNKEYEISFPLLLNEKTKGKYKIFSISKNIDLQILANMLEWGSLSVNVSYDLWIEEVYMGQIHYHLEYEVLE